MIEDESGLGLVWNSSKHSHGFLEKLCSIGRRLDIGVVTKNQTDTLRHRGLVQLDGEIAKNITVGFDPKWFLIGKTVPPCDGPTRIKVDILITQAFHQSQNSVVS